MYMGRGQSCHQLLTDAYAIHYKKELAGDHIQDLHAQLEQAGENDTHVLAAAAALAQAAEVGKTVQSTHEWMTTSSEGELTLCRMTHQVGDRLTDAMMGQNGEEYSVIEEIKAGQGHRRDYRVCRLLRGEDAQAAMRAGGLLVRNSATRREWDLFTRKVGTSAEMALVALLMVARLLGGIQIRFLREIKAFPLLLFKLLREFWRDCTDEEAKEHIRNFARTFRQTRNCVLGFHALTHRARFPSLRQLLSDASRYSLLAQAILQWTASVLTERVHSRGRAESADNDKKGFPMPAERLAARQLIRDAVTKYEVLRRRFPKHWDRDYVVPPPQPDPAPGPDAHAKAKAAPLAKAKPKGRPRGSWPYRVWRSKQPIEESITVDHAAKAILGRFSN